MASPSSPFLLSLLLLLLLLASDSLAAESKSRVHTSQTLVVGKLPTVQSVLISDKSTLLSANHTFELGFFSVDGGSNFYAGIWYASIPIRTYVWVANPEHPVPRTLNHSSSSSPESGIEMGITAEGVLAIADARGTRVWWTANYSGKAAKAELLETGNLALVSGEGKRVWQSFDSPRDTWLPEMEIKVGMRITGWKSSSDPTPGNYSLQLRPLQFGEFELVYRDGAASYWSTGNWTGDSFAGVPEMTVPYIYTFRFDRPFTAAASFTYSQSADPGTAGKVLTRFVVDPEGVLRQYVWFPQSQNWAMFWARPESPCRVYALCGDLGFCSPAAFSPCQCLPGFAPANAKQWLALDFSSGCRRSGGSPICSSGDGFRSIGSVDFSGATVVTLQGAGRSSCEGACLSSCSCLGFTYNPSSATCQNFYNRILNLRNQTADNGQVSNSRVLYLRVGKQALERHKQGSRQRGILIGCAAGIATAMAVTAAAFAFWWRRRRTSKGGGEAAEVDEAVFSALQLAVFSYKELNAATRGFSEKLGHGGFGGVFLGKLPGGARVAVKRLERPGGAGEREFRAEVCTIGSVQHVNLVRLRGFCCERAHRLLVYEYMPNGPLSAYLGPRGRPIRWEARFRVALGTARGIAYLHEECRNCIIHCDIKPENILLDVDYGPKVSDFGLAKLVGRDFSRVVATMRGTWGYVAPEWISGTAITAKADVYSYGMTLLEIIGGRRNVEGGPEVDNRWFFPPWAAKEIVEGRVEGVVDERLGGDYDRAEAMRAGLVAVWCIQDEEAARPSMSTVVKMLQGTVNIGLPPAPQLLQALVAEDSFTEAGGAVSNSSGMRSDGFFPENRLSSSF